MVTRDNPSPHSDKVDAASTRYYGFQVLLAVVPVGLYTHPSSPVVCVVPGHHPRSHVLERRSVRHFVEASVVVLILSHRRSARAVDTIVPRKNYIAV